MRCEYNLAGLDPAGLCPECGHRIDDSIRARGLWTVARVRRLRWVVAVFLVAALAWLPIAALIASEFVRVPGARRVSRDLLQGCAILTLLAHAAGLACAAIGGTFASSRQGYHRRLAMSMGLSAIVVIAAGCLAAAVGGSRPLQRAFEDWGFIASGATRTVGITLACHWVMLGVRQSGLSETRRRRAGTLFLWIYPAAWTLFLGAIAVPPLQRWLVTDPGDTLLALFLFLDALAVVTIAAVGVSLVSSKRFETAIVGVAVPPARDDGG